MKVLTFTANGRLYRLRVEDSVGHMLTSADTGLWFFALNNTTSKGIVHFTLSQIDSKL